MALDIGDARIRKVMAGAAGAKGAAPRGQAAPAAPDMLRRLIGAIASPAAAETPSGVRALRDRAMPLNGFGAALRRSEVAALTLGDVVIVARKGGEIRVRRAKADQTSKGRRLGIHAIPVERS